MYLDKFSFFKTRTLTYQQTFSVHAGPVYSFELHMAHKQYHKQPNNTVAYPYQPSTQSREAGEWSKQLWEKGLLTPSCELFSNSFLKHTIIF